LTIIFVRILFLATVASDDIGHIGTSRGKKILLGIHQTECLFPGMGQDSFCLLLSTRSAMIPWRWGARKVMMPAAETIFDNGTKLKPPHHRVPK